MTTYNSQENQLIITFPNKGIQDLQDYRRSILGLLAKVEIENCNPNVKGDIKILYELLSHLQTEEEFLAQQRELLIQASDQKSQQVMLQS